MYVSITVAYPGIWKGFPLVDPRCRGLEVQPPAAEEVLSFKSILTNEKLDISFPVDISKLWLVTLSCSSQ